MKFIPIDIKENIYDLLLRSYKRSFSCDYDNNNMYKLTSYRDEHGAKITVSVYTTIIGEHQFPCVDNKISITDIWMSVQKDIQAYLNTPTDLGECERCNKDCCYGCPYANC